MNKKETSSKRPSSLPPDLVFGEWQLCPKCAGQGQIFQTQLSYHTSIGWINCDVCLGAKIIARPILPIPSLKS